MQGLQRLSPFVVLESKDELDPPGAAEVRVPRPCPALSVEQEQELRDQHMQNDPRDERSRDDSSNAEGLAVYPLTGGAGAYVPDQDSEENKTEHFKETLLVTGYNQGNKAIGTIEKAEAPAQITSDQWKYLRWSLGTDVHSDHCDEPCVACRLW